MKDLNRAIADFSELARQGDAGWQHEAMLSRGDCYFHLCRMQNARRDLDAAIQSVRTPSRTAFADA